MCRPPVLFFAGCLVLCLFLVGGCAPKKVRVYEGVEELRAAVVQFAMAQAGKPYRLGAKGPDSFDCSGLVFFAYNKYGIRLPQTAELLGQTGYDVDPGVVLPGDLVFFLVKKEHHVGIMINKKDFVHASKSKGVAVDTVDAPYWRRGLSQFRSLF
jgi:cell wall-associated NlpC family hydrolase